MKIGEKIYEEDGKLIIKKSHDFTPVMKQMEEMRRNGVIGMGGAKTTASDTRFIARIPLPLIEKWCKDEGVKWEDAEARGEVVKRKILSGEVDAFRSDWKGNY
jgi:hypothetical protein